MLKRKALNSQPVIYVTLEKCGCCGQEHERLKFHKFSRRQTRYTYGTLCPTTGEPILCRQVDRR